MRRPAQFEGTGKKSATEAAEWFEGSRRLIRGALARRLNRTADIDDLAQEVYLRLLRVPRPDLVRNPQAYLYRVAINVAEEWRARAAQSFDHSSEALQDLAAQDDLERDAGQRQRAQAIRQALEALPEASRTAVLLHVRNGMTYEEVARHMGVSRRAVKRYVAKGYAALRLRLHAFAGSGGLADADP